MRKHVFYTTDGEGRRQSHRLIVSGDEFRGRVNPFDAKVFDAFEAYFTEILDTEGDLPAVVPFSIYRIGQLLGYSKLAGYERTPGSVYGQIKSSIRRIRAMNLISERAFWNSESEEWIELEFNVFTTVAFRGEQDQKGRIHERGWIGLHPLYHGNLVTQNVKYYNYPFLLTLAPLDARIYKLLSFKFYGIKQQNPARRFYRVDYLNWCQSIPTTPQTKYSDAKRSFDRAHKNLIEAGVITEVRYGKPRKRDGKTTFNITYFVGERILREMRGQFGETALQSANVVVPPKATRRDMASRSDVSTDDDPTEIAPSRSPELVAQLVKRSVKPTDAAKLVADFADDRIREQVEHHDYVKEKRPDAIDHSGSWLIAAIRKPFDLPQSLLDRRELRLRAEKVEDRHQRWETERKRRVEADLANWDATSPEERIAGRLDAATSRWSSSFKELVRELGSKEKAAERVKQELLAGLPKTEAERRAYVERQHDLMPPADFK